MTEDLSAEERKLLAAAEGARPRRVRPRPDESTPTTATSERGPLSTAQHDDDGWGDTPVQMRG